MNAGNSVTLNAGSITTAGNVSLTGNTGTVNETSTGLISAALLTTNSALGTMLGSANTVANFNLLQIAARVCVLHLLTQ